MAELRPKSGQSEVDDSAILEIFKLLASEPDQGWKQFLELFAGAIYRALSVLEPDAERTADCFLFVCEQLCRNGFARLRRFKPNGPARFTTWLKIVVRNLHVDWHRKQFGRRRDPKTIAKLSGEEQQIYRLACEDGLSSAEILGYLKTRDQSVTEERLERALTTIREALSPRFSESLASRRVQQISLEVLLEGSAVVPAQLLTSPAASPEVVVIETETSRRLRRSVNALPSHDRLLLRLRFAQGLTLREVARACGLKDAQTVDREIQAILDRLRKKIT